MDLRLILVLCAFTATQAATHSSSEIFTQPGCAPQCKGSELNEYEQLKTYVYKYSAKNWIQAWNAHVDLNGDVLITRLNTCDYALELKNVAISGVPNAKSLEGQLIARSLRFSWIDGEIQDICHDPEEDSWVLNVKRAILSSIQVSAPGYRQKVERDILGDCETTYVQGEMTKESFPITKTKKMVTCRNHYDEPIAAAVQAVYAVGQPEYHCIQTWSNRYILKSLDCSHAASTSAQITANVTLKLDRTMGSSKVAPLAQYKRSNLLWTPVKPVKQSAQQVEQILTGLCKSIENEIKEAAPQQFRQFVTMLESLTYPELKNLWEKVASGQHQQCRSERVKALFVDALVQSRSGSSLKLLIKDLLKTKAVSELRVKAVIHSLVYKTKPSMEAMEAIIELLESSRVMKQSLFGVTAAIQKYWDMGYEKSLALRALDQVIRRFNSAANEEDKTVIARALGNIHFDSDKITGALEQYISRGNPELRIAAIETLARTAACKPSIVSALRQVIYQVAQPNEVRVRAVKVFLRCANNERDIDELKTHLAVTNDREFVSYVDSYLKNALKTMNPDKQIVKEIVGLGQSTWTHPKSTFSRNIEFSRMTKDGLIGLNYEVDSIVENGQKIPAWLVVNASIPVRRENTLNLEFGVRQEGMEKLFAKVMNQMNQINVQDWEKIYTNAKAQRDVTPVVREVVKILEEIQRIAQRNAKLSAYLKINGVTLFYWNTLPSSVDYYENVRRFVTENSPFSKLVETGLGWIFINYQVNLPLASGLGVHYWQQGSIVPGLKASIKTNKVGAVDTHNFALFPNFALEHVFGHELTMDKELAGGYRQTTLGSNFVTEGVHRVEKSGETEIHTLSIDAKQPEMDLFRIQSVLVIREASGKERRELNARVHHEFCSTRFTEKLLGVAFCAEAKSQSNEIPINQDFAVRMYTKKIDKNMKTYEITLRKEQGLRSIALDTPGSAVNRKLDVTIGHEGDLKPKKNFQARYWVKVNSPFKALEGTASLAFPAEGEWSLFLDSRVDSKAHSVRLALKPKANKQHNLNILVTSPLVGEKLDYDLTFTNPMEAGQELMAQLHSNVKGGNRNRIVKIRATRDFTRDDKKATLEFEWNNHKSEKIFSVMAEGSLKGSLPVINSLRFTSQVDYLRSIGKLENLKFNGNLKTSETAAKTINSNWELISSQWPQINGKLNHKLFYKPQEHLENEVDLKWGRDFESETNPKKLSLRQITILNQGTAIKGAKTIKNEYRVEYRPAGINHEGKVEITFIPRSLELVKIDMTHVNLNQKDRQIKFSLDHSLARGVGATSFSWHWSRGSRSVKSSYTLDQVAPKVNVIYKVEPVGKPVHGYNVQTQLTRNPRSGKGSFVSFEVSTFPEHKPIIKAKSEYSRIDKRNVKFASSVDYKDSRIVDTSFERKSNEYNAIANLPNGNFKFIVNGDKKEAYFTAKTNQEWEHELTFVNRPTEKKFKSITKVGVKQSPDIEISFDQGKQIVEISVIDKVYTFASNLRQWNSEPVFRVDFKCLKHGDSHSTELQWLKATKKISSEQQRRGKVLYRAEFTNENQDSTVKSNLNLHVGQHTVKARNTVNRQTGQVALEVVSNVAGYEGNLQGKIDLPTSRRARFARWNELPKASLEAKLKKGSTESSIMVKVVPDNHVRVHFQHQTVKGIEMLFDSKLMADKVYFQAQCKNDKISFNLSPRGEEKSLKVEYKGKGQREGLIDLKINKKDTKLTINGKSFLKKANGQEIVNIESNIDSNLRKDRQTLINGEFNQDWTIRGISERDLKWNSKLNLNINRNLVDGPHKIIAKSDADENQIIVSYKLTDKKQINLDLQAITEKRQLIKITLEGDKNERSNQLLVNGKMTLNSEHFAALRDVKFNVEFTRKPGQVDFTLKKSDPKPMSLAYHGNLRPGQIKHTFEVNGVIADGKARKLEIVYQQADKLDFSAKLFELKDLHSEVKVQIPLVQIAQFIGKEASFTLRSKYSKIDVDFNLKAPSNRVISGRALVSHQGKPVIEYTLKVDDGSSEKFLGQEKMIQGDLSQLSIVQKLTYKRQSLLQHALLYTDNFIAVNLITKPLTIRQSISGLKAAPQILAEICWEKAECSKIDAQIELKQIGWIKMNVEIPRKSAKYNLDSNWNLTPGKESGKWVAIYQGRRYGHEWSRKANGDKHAEYTSKLYLPRRVMNIELSKKIDFDQADKFLGRWIVKMTPKENAEAVIITIDRDFKRTSSNFAANHKVTLVHKELSKPLTLKTNLDYAVAESRELSIFGYKGQKITLGVDFEGNDENDLNAVFSWNLEKDSKLKYGARLWQANNAIDFGCEGLYHKEGSFRAYDWNILKHYTCHWVDRNGQKTTLSRKQGASMFKLNGLPKISFHDNYDHPLWSYLYNATYHKSAPALRDATVDFETKGGLKYRAKAQLNLAQPEKCLEISLFAVPQASDEKYGIRTCLNIKPRAGSKAFTFDILTYNSGSEMTQGEKKISFYISRMKDFVNDYLISLTWDSSSMADASVQILDQVEAITQRGQNLKNEQYQELKAKYTVLKNSVGGRVIKPLKSAWVHDVQELTKEMKPEAEYFGKIVKRAVEATRVRRSIARFQENTQADLTSPMTYEWLVYNPDHGQLQLVVRNVECHKVPRFVYEILLKNSLV